MTLDAAAAHPPFAVPVSGVVDGLLTAAPDTDGNVCLYAVVSWGPLTGEDRLEFVLDHQEAEALRRVLERPGDATGPVTCRVGMHLAPRVSTPRARIQG